MTSLGSWSADVDRSSETSIGDSEILDRVNSLLSNTGFRDKPIMTFDDLQKSASSMFVAMFESIFQVRLKGVVRQPAHVHDYIHNAQVVINALAGSVIRMDLGHITGEAIVNGDKAAIRNMVVIFQDIIDLISSQRDKAVRPAAPVMRRFRTVSGLRKRQSHTSKQKPAFSTRSWPSPSRKVTGSLHNTAAKSRGMRERLEPADPSPHQRHRPMSQQSGYSQPPVHIHPADVRSGVGSASVSSAALEKSDVPEQAPRQRSRLMDTMDERSKRAQGQYRQVLKDRLLALQLRERLDATKQYYRHKSVLRNRKMQQVKLRRLQENLHLRALAMKLRYEDEQQGQLTSLYKKILLTVHRQRREDEREDAARLRTLEQAWASQSEDLERFYHERLHMVNELGKTSQEQRAQVLKAQEATLSELLARYTAAYEARLQTKMDKIKLSEDAQYHHTLDAKQAYADLMGVEDWQHVNKDRFMAVQPSSAFQARLRQVQRQAASAKRRTAQNVRDRSVRSAYGRHF